MSFTRLAREKIARARLLKEAREEKAKSLEVKKGEKGERGEPVLLKGDTRRVYPTHTAGPDDVIEFTTNLEQNLKEYELSFSPVQDLHGYDSPWPAGGGKQLLNPATFESFPAEHNGVTASLNTDGTFSLSGTATADSYITIVGYNTLSDWGIFEADTSYTLSGYHSTSVFGMLGVYGAGTDYRANQAEGITLSFTAEQISSLRYRLVIYTKNGTNTNGITLKPMICKTSASNPATFAPYSNICPITGWTGAEVTRTDGQDPPVTSDTYSIAFPSEAGTVYGGTLTVQEDGTGELVVDRANIASYAGETLPGEWISSMDVYAAGATPTTGAQVVYELATPQTYTLTAPQISTLLGSNVLWADAGEMSAEYYYKDTTAPTPKEKALMWWREHLMYGVNVPRQDFFKK